MRQSNAAAVNWPYPLWFGADSLKMLKSQVMTEDERKNKQLNKKRERVKVASGMLTSSNSVCALIRLICRCYRGMWCCEKLFLCVRQLFFDTIGLFRCLRSCRWESRAQPPLHNWIQERGSICPPRTHARTRTHTHSTAKNLHGAFKTCHNSKRDCHFSSPRIDECVLSAKSMGNNWILSALIDYRIDFIKRFALTLFQLLVFFFWII